MGPLATVAVPAAINAVSGVGSSLVGKHSNKKALEAQTKASQEALAMEKENEAYRRSEARRIEDLQRAQFEAEQARLEPYRQAKAAFLRSQGINLPDAPRPAFMPGQAQAAQPAASPRSPFAGMVDSAQPDVGANINPVSLQEIMSWGSRFGARR